MGMTAYYANYAKGLHELAYNDCNGLEYLYNINYKNWHFETTSILASHNNLPCLQHAISLGCPFHNLTAFHTSYNGYVDILAYIIVIPSYFKLCNVMILHPED